MTDFHALATEAAAEARSDFAVRHGWLCALRLHAWARWEIAGKLVCDGDVTGRFQSRQCLRCGLVQDRDA